MTANSTPAVKSVSSVKFYMATPDNTLKNFLSMNGFDHTTFVNEADVAVFPGGADVTPFLYGERPLKETQSDFIRDRDEVRLFKELPTELPKIGVCRGAQFLNVMSGGRLFQHVTNHAIAGLHVMREMYTDNEIPVTSTHHQMMRPSDDAHVIAVAQEAYHKYADGYQKVYDTHIRKLEWDDVEVAYYRTTNAICYQPHPEYAVKGNRGNQQFFIDTIETYLFTKEQCACIAAKRAERTTKG